MVVKWEEVFKDEQKLDWEKVFPEKPSEPTPLNETLQPEQQETFLFKVFDILQRGQYASANVAKALIEGKGNLAVEAWKGLSGKEKASYIDILKKENIPYAHALGLILDIGLDPTTYIPFGTLTKPLKFLKETKLFTKIKDLPLVEALGKTFIPGYGLPKEYYTKKLMARYGLQAKELEVLNRIGELNHGLTSSDRTLLSQVRQNPEMIDELSPFLKKRLDEIAKEFEKIGEEAVEEKLITKEAFEELKDVYLPGYYSGKTRLPSGITPPPYFEKGKKFIFGRKKKFKTLEEAEEYARQADRPDLIPEKDILKLLGIRKIAQARFLAQKKFVDDVLREFGEKVPADIKKIPEGYGLYLPKGPLRFYPVEVIKKFEIDDLLAQKNELMELTPDKFTKLIGVSKDVPAYLLPQEIAKDLNKIQSFFIGDPATYQLLRQYDKILGAWKAMATSIRVPFHLRNMQSNWFLMWLGGVNPATLPIRMKQALAIQKGQKGSLKIGNEVISYDEIRKLLDEYGIRGRGWIAADIPQYAFKEMERILEGTSIFQKAIRHPFREISRVGREVGKAIEDNSRIGLFIDALMKGENAAEAAQRVRRYLFDYQELTPFEQNVMKRVIPFYTWLRRNIPLQIASVLEQPGKYATVGKIYDMLDKKIPETAEEQRLKPDYFKEMIFRKTPFKTEKGKPVYAAIDLPYTDLQRMTSLAHILSSTTPAKTIMEISTNLMIFPEIGRKIEDPLGKKVPAPFYMLWLPDEVKKFLKAEIIVDRLSGEKILGIPAKYKYALDVTFPFLAEISKIFSQPIKIEEERKPWRILSYATGIKFMPVDLEMQRYYQMIDRKNKLDEARRLMMNLGRPLTKEELKAILNEK